MAPRARSRTQTRSRTLSVDVESPIHPDTLGGTDMKARLALVLLVPLAAMALIPGCSRGGTASQTPAPSATVTVKGTVQNPLPDAQTNAFAGKSICVVAVKGTPAVGDIAVDEKTLEFTTRGSVPPSSTIDSNGNFEVAMDRSLLQKLGTCTLLVVDTTPGDLLELDYVGSGTGIVQFGPADVKGSQLDLGAGLQEMSKGSMFERKP